MIENTTDLSEFGYREIEMAKELLNAWMDNGLPDDFYSDKVTIMFNPDSGCVFLTNSDYQVAMMNSDKLESFYYLPYSGEEGFKEDFEDLNPEDLNTEDLEFLQSIGLFLDYERE
jgi:hypothetical protein